MAPVVHDQHFSDDTKPACAVHFADDGLRSVPVHPTQAGYRGSSRLFIPDYLIRMSNGVTLVLEIKGQDDEQNRAKRAAMETWIQAVNEHGGFGHWKFSVAFDPAKIRDLIYAAEKES